ILGISYCNALNFVERYLVGRPVVELGCLRRLVGRDLLGLLDGPPRLQVGGDAGRPERVVADAWRESGGDGPALDYVERVVPAEGLGRERFAPASDRAEEGSLRIPGGACGLQVGVEVRLGVVVGGHLVGLPALLVEPEPPAL